MGKINLETLILYNNIRLDEIVISAVKIFNEFDYHEYISYMEADYYMIQRELLKNVTQHNMEGTYWQKHICGLIAESENRFSLMSEKGEVDEQIHRLALREIEELKKIYHMEWHKINAVFHENDVSVCTMRSKQENSGQPDRRDTLRKALETESNEETVGILKGYYQDYGCGIFERYQAFLWDDALVGVTNYDRITFDRLIGYEPQKKAVIENTEFFLKGYPANNVLLHGDRGTGKSSCVKALLNHFGNKLKLISLNKNHMEHFYRIIEAIAHRGCKFIIFIDDLSFEDTEIGYKHFKSVIDGGIETQPENILIYVTSNRRNLIKETWKDRGENGEVHTNDGMQERLSLADRFGLSITFTSPDKEEFLTIVKGIASREKLGIGETKLIEEALKWDIRQKGRSGRSARQFVNYIHAKTKENEC